MPAPPPAQSAAAAADPSPDLGILGILPAEIRLQIYDEVLVGKPDKAFRGVISLCVRTGRIMRSGDRCFRPGHAPGVALLRASRRIHAEAATLLYKGNEFPLCMCWAADLTREATAARIGGDGVRDEDGRRRCDFQVAASQIFACAPSQVVWTPLGRSAGLVESVVVRQDAYAGYMAENPPINPNVRPPVWYFTALPRNICAALPALRRVRFLLGCAGWRQLAWRASYWPGLLRSMGPALDQLEWVRFSMDSDLDHIWPTCDSAEERDLLSETREHKVWEAYIPRLAEALAAHTKGPWHMAMNYTEQSLRSTQGWYVVGHKADVCAWRTGRHGAGAGGDVAAAAAAAGYPIKKVWAVEGTLGFVERRDAVVGGAGVEREMSEGLVR